MMSPWDTCGSGIIRDSSWLYSITSIQSFQRIPELHRWIQETKPGDGGKGSVLIVGNKSDNMNRGCSFRLKI